MRPISLRFHMEQRGKNSKKRINCTIFKDHSSAYQVSDRSRAVDKIWRMAIAGVTSHQLEKIDGRRRPRIPQGVFRAPRNYDKISCRQLRRSFHALDFERAASPHDNMKHRAMSRYTESPGRPELWPEINTTSQPYSSENLIEQEFAGE